MYKMQECKYNKELCQQLLQIGNYYQKHKQTFRSLAYKKAVRAIIDWEQYHHRKLKLHDFELTTVGKTGKIKKIYTIEGIGAGIAKKISQYLTTGEIEEYALAKQNKLLDKKIKQGKIAKLSKRDHQINELTGISFIGTAKAKQLIDTFKITSISQLKKAVQNKKNYTDKKNVLYIPTKHGELTLTQNQVVMLKYHDQVANRVPREFTEQFEKTLKKMLRSRFGPGNRGKNWKFELSGSYRRGKPDSGDVDMLVESNVFSLDELVDLLTDAGILFFKLGQGKHDYKGLATCPGKKDFVFRIDIMMPEPEEWATSLLHFTGPDFLNRVMRQKAKDLRTRDIPNGAILSQKGLFHLNANGKPTDRRIPIQTERDVFKILGMKYLPPTARGDKNK